MAITDPAFQLPNTIRSDTSEATGAGMDPASAFRSVPNASSVVPVSGSQQPATAPVKLRLLAAIWP